MTDKGWPGEPGVPLNPEQDGWHWLTATTGRPSCHHWNAQQRSWWMVTEAHSAQIVGRAPLISYVGPCHTPAALAAAKEEGRREGAEMMKEAAIKIIEDGVTTAYGQGLIARDRQPHVLIATIRALPAPPQPQEPPHE